jgi:hypothetical protein
VLEGSLFDEPDELLSAIQEIVREVDRETSMEMMDMLSHVETGMFNSMFETVDLEMLS